jgi:hypothetical protein
VDVTDLACKVEDYIRPRDYIPRNIGYIRIHNADAISHRRHVEDVPAASGKQIIDNSDVRAFFDKPDYEIASDESESPSNQCVLARISHPNKSFTAFSSPGTNAIPFPP